MKLRQLKLCLKWLWVFAVVASLAFYLSSRWDTVEIALSNFSLAQVGSSFALLLLAKCALSENALAAARAVNLPLGRFSIYRLYSFSQLGKYVPGSVWQFVGRGASYRFAGGDYSSIAAALFLETSWVVGGAAVLGAFLAGPALAQQILQAGLVSLERALLCAVAATLVVSLVVLLAGPYLRRLRPHRFCILRGARVVFLQMVIWAVLGLSFGVLLPYHGEGVPIWYVIGLFAIAYIVGFAAVFAPAGLGVREAVLVLGLNSYIQSDQALVVVLVARALYLVTELTMAGGMLVLGVAGPKAWRDQLADE